MPFDIHQILNLAGQLGGDHQGLAQELGGVLGQGGQVDPQQHAGLLSRFGIDPQQLQSGGYDQQFQQQAQPGFGGYQPGMDPAMQQPDFSQQQGYGGYDPDQGGGGYGQQQGYDPNQGGGYDPNQGGGYDPNQGGGYGQQQGYGQDRGYDPNQAGGRW